MSNKPSKVWIEQINAHLDLLDQVCSRCPGGEHLEVKDLNKVLVKFASAQNKFLLMCELNGFNVKKEYK